MIHFCHEEAQQLAAIVTGSGGLSLWLRFHRRQIALWLGFAALRASILVRP